MNIRINALPKRLAVVFSILAPIVTLMSDTSAIKASMHSTAAVAYLLVPEDLIITSAIAGLFGFSLGYVIKMLYLQKNIWGVILALFVLTVSVLCLIIWVQIKSL